MLPFLVPVFIHILNTGCAKFKRKIRRQRVKMVAYRSHRTCAVLTRSLAVNHSVLVLPQLVGGPMVSKHDHLWLFTLLTCLDIQHQFRLRVLNVEWHLHKQDRLYSREQNEAAYAGVPKTQTARLPPVHWPTDLIIQQAICTYKVRIQGC